MLLDPYLFLESTAAGKLFRLRVRVAFSVVQMIFDKFRIIPEWNIYKDPPSKRGTTLPQNEVISSLYNFRRAATYDNITFSTLRALLISSTLRALLITHEAQ